MAGRILIKCKILPPSRLSFNESSENLTFLGFQASVELNQI